MEHAFPGGLMFLSNFSAPSVSFSENSIHAFWAVYKSCLSWSFVSRRESINPIKDELILSIIDDIINKYPEEEMFTFYKYDALSVNGDHSNALPISIH